MSFLDSFSQAILAQVPPGGAMPASHLTAGQWGLYLLTVAVLIVICAFFAASETSLLSVRDSRIAQLVEEGNPRARIVERLRDHPERMLVSIQIVVTLVTTLSSALATSVAEHVLSWLGEGIAIAIATVLVLFFLSLFGEITPKNWAIGHSERMALIAAPVIDWVSNVIVAPLAWLLETLSVMIIRLFGDQKPMGTPYSTEEEIKLIVEESARFGELEQEEKEMIHKVMEIEGITAREIMTPRIDIIGVDIATPIPDVVKVIIDEGHSRIPVYRETVDDIVGILHAKDLLKVLGNGQHTATLEELMMRALHIPESKKVDKLLKEFKATKAQMAVVLDEYGGTAGIVTMEDVLEEIVGPIGDEYDEPEEKDIILLSPGVYRVTGSANLEEIMESLDLEIEEDEEDLPDTIGGFVFNRLGRVPKVGDSVNCGGWQMEVENVEGRRVDHLRMSRLEQVEEEEGKDE